MRMIIAPLAPSTIRTANEMCGCGPRNKKLVAIGSESSQMIKTHFNTFGRYFDRWLIFYGDKNFRNESIIKVTYI